MRAPGFRFLAIPLLVVCLVAHPVVSSAQNSQPNILVIMSDDVGITNISAYSRGLVGYQTPNIDRIAQQGAVFTDYYAEQSCTAGRGIHYRPAPDPYGADEGGDCRVTHRPAG